MTELKASALAGTTPNLIAIVDDDTAFRDSLGRLLRSLGHSVAAFDSAAEFLASPKLLVTACLVADVHMPEMTGIQLYLVLARMQPIIPTILVTAYPSDTDRKAMLSAGVECYLEKPLDQASLIACLGRALRGAKRK